MLASTKSIAAFFWPRFHGFKIFKELLWELTSFTKPQIAPTMNLADHLTEFILRQLFGRAPPIAH
jgi:hypothetical protein